MGQVSILMKERRWVEHSRDEVSGLLVERFERKNFPTSVWRCTGRVCTSATPAQLAEVCFAINERRRWDSELTKETRTLDVLEQNRSVFEYEARGASMGGVVSGRGYVDLRGQRHSKGHAEVFWGSVEWPQDMQDGLVRGWNHPQGVYWDEVDNGEYELRFIAHRDVKGCLPYAAAEQAMPGSMTFWWKAL